VVPASEQPARATQLHPTAGEAPQVHGCTHSMPSDAAALLRRVAAPLCQDLRLWTSLHNHSMPLTRRLLSNGYTTLKLDESKQVTQIQTAGRIHARKNWLSGNPSTWRLRCHRKHCGWGWQIWQRAAGRVQVARMRLAAHRRGHRAPPRKTQPRDSHAANWPADGEEPTKAMLHCSFSKCAPRWLVSADEAAADGWTLGSQQN